MGTPKDTANQIGDAKQDFGDALDHISDPQAAAEDVSRGLRHAGLDSAADAIDNVLGEISGLLPDPVFEVYWGKAGMAEAGINAAEGFIDDALGQTGVLGDTFLHSGLVDKALQRGEDELAAKLGQGQSIWKVNSFDLVEGLSTPWRCTLVLHAKEVDPQITPDGGPKGFLNHVADDFKSGNVENAIGDVAGMLGIPNPDPFAGSQNKPGADDHPPQRGVALDPADYLNQNLSIGLARKTKTTSGTTVVERWFTGVVSQFQDLGSNGSERFMSVTLVPSLWMLSLRHDCRIWQEMSALEIVRDVFASAQIYHEGLLLGIATPVDKLLDAIHTVPPQNVSRGDWTPRRQMCVQYNETDLDFVQRLLEEEGISYYFECKKRDERIVFVDDPFQLDKCRTVNGKDVPFVRTDEITFAHPKGSAGRADDDKMRGWQPEVVWELSLKQRTRANKVTLRDYNFRLPQMAVPADNVPSDGGKPPYTQELTSTTDSGKVLIPKYDLGKSGWEQSGDDTAGVGHYLAPSPIPHPLDVSNGDIKQEPYKPDGVSAEDLATRRRDALRSEMEQGLGASNVIELRPGRLLSVVGYLSYRNQLDAFQSGLQADWKVPDSTDTDPYSTWQSTQQTRDSLRDPRDEVYKKPYLLLVTRNHIWANGQNPATFPAPPELVGTQVRWDSTATGTTPTGMMAMVAGTGVSGAVKHEDLKQTGPGTPIPGFTAPGADGDLAKQMYYNQFEFVIVDSDRASAGAGAQNAGYALRYRPKHTVARPRIRGLQTALVVDADNRSVPVLGSVDLSQGLEMDSLGYRVRLHMHWDRRGDWANLKPKSTCWVRMTTPWTGTTDARDWGTMFVPRVGMEVVVGFIDGNPDQPVILGAVPNGHRQPAVVPLPQPVVKRTPPEGDPQPVITDDPEIDPAKPVSLANETHRNRSVIRTHSEPALESSSGNWVVFDDNHPNEWVQLRAQKLLMKEVLHDYKISVGTYETPYTDTHKQVFAVGGDYTETVKGDAWMPVSGTRDITVKGAESRIQYHADHATFIIGDEVTTIERGRSATIEGFETLVVGPAQVDADEKPEEPRMLLKVHGSQLLTVKNHEGKTPPNGDDKLHVRKDKTDTIGAKLTLDSKGGLQIGAHPAGGAKGGSADGQGGSTADKDPGKDTHISAGVPPNTATLELQSQDDINLSSEGIVRIHSDRNDVHMHGDKNLQVTAEDKTLKLMLKDPEGKAQDVLLWGKSEGGPKRIRLAIDGDGPASELTVGAEGIKLTLGGDKPSSLEITPTGEIKLKGGILKMVAKNNVTLSGQVVFKGK